VTLPVKLYVALEHSSLASPFRTAAHTVVSLAVIRVELTGEGHTGRGEAAGVFYKKDTPAGALGQIESLRSTIEAGISRDILQRLLPPGGARNALDCALWDLEAKREGRPVWQMLGLEAPRPLLTTFTCGAEEPEKMAARALSYAGAQAIKLKLIGDDRDADRVQAVRDALPAAWLAVDGNQGQSRVGLEQLLPILLRSRVALIEQPFPSTHDEWLDDIESPIPIAADESVQCLTDIPALVGRFDTVNIKLDKCGGLTEGFAMARAARECGLDAMVGNMLGTSLAMAPAFLVGQLCQVVDLDGPIYLTQDCPYPVRYRDGHITCPDELWGHGHV
jgi:L-alanine-DL-glutamate epimerase-like enolase superfamily enzyme